MSGVTMQRLRAATAKLNKARPPRAGSMLSESSDRVVIADGEGGITAIMSGDLARSIRNAVGMDGNHGG